MTKYRTHLLATDPSVLELLALCDDLECTAVVVPQNRSTTLKVEALRHKAYARHLPVFVHERGASLSEDLPSADLAVSWMYSQIVPAGSLPRYRIGLLNMHGGQIPSYRGASVLQWAIINGERELWATWHEIVEEVDAGPIYAEAPIPLPDDWTAAQARIALIQTGIRLFPEAWRRKRDGMSPVRWPDLSQGHVWPQRRPRDSEVLPGWKERQLRDFVRALCPPWPPPVWLGRPVAGISVTADQNTVPYVCEDGVTLHLILNEPI